MKYRVCYRVSYIDVWKEFDNLFDAANYASEMRGTTFESHTSKEPIKGLRIEFIEPEEETEEPENNSAPTSTD